MQERLLSPDSSGQLVSDRMLEMNLLLTGFGLLTRPTPAEKLGLLVKLDTVFGDTLNTFGILQFVPVQSQSRLP